jgi:hypothetical protein
MVEMVNRPDNSSYHSPGPKISTAEKRTHHRKPIFAKPLIDNYLHEIGEVGLNKRPSDRGSGGGAREPETRTLADLSY